VSIKIYVYFAEMSVFTARCYAEHGYATEVVRPCIRL